MRNFSRLVRFVLSLSCIIPLLASQAAVAHAAAPGTVSLDQPAYTAHESQGYLAITVQRTGDLSQAEHVGYGVKRQDAQPGIDFDVVPNTYITMAPGQQSVTFQVRIIDRGMNGTPVHALAYLYGSWPGGSSACPQHSSPRRRRGSERTARQA